MARYIRLKASTVCLTSLHCCLLSLDSSCSTGQQPVLHSQLSCFSLSTSWSYVVTALCRLFLFFVVVDLVFCAFAPDVMITGKVVVITHGDILKIEIFYGWFQFFDPAGALYKTMLCKKVAPNFGFFTQPDSTASQ